MLQTCNTEVPWLDILNYFVLRIEEASNKTAVQLRKSVKLINDEFSGSHANTYSKKSFYVVYTNTKKSQIL